MLGCSGPTDTRLVSPDALVVVPVSPPQAVCPAVNMSITQPERKSLKRRKNTECVACIICYLSSPVLPSMEAQLSNSISDLLGKLRILIKQNGEKQ